MLVPALEIIPPEDLHMVEGVGVHGGTSFRDDGGDPAKAVILVMATSQNGVRKNLTVAIRSSDVPELIDRVREILAGQE